MKHIHKLFAPFLILTLNLCIGCLDLSTVGNSLLEATSNVNIFTDEEEIQIGRAFVAEHEREIKLYTDTVVTNYINALGQHLVRYSKRNDIPYTFKVVDTKGVNAYAVPGGFIYVHLDLIRAAKTESELAAVLGHEIGHIVGRHSMKRLTQVYGIEILKQLILDEDDSTLKKLGRRMFSPQDCFFGTVVIMSGNQMFMECGTFTMQAFIRKVPPPFLRRFVRSSGEIPLHWKSFYLRIRCRANASRTSVTRFPDCLRSPDFGQIHHGSGKSNGGFGSDKKD